MKVTYERDLNRTWLVLEEEQVYQEDYQMKMLKANTLRYLLPVLWQGRDESSSFRYEITGKLSMRGYFERNKMTCQEIEAFVRQLAEAMNEARNFLLEPDRILISPDYVFWEKGQFWFCYYPLQTEPVWKEFHRLTEYFVREADYRDQEGVCLISELHRASMEENYSIWQTVENIQEAREEKRAESREEKEEPPPEEYRTGSWGEETTESAFFIREEPEELEEGGLLGRLRLRKKRKRWGEWDGLEL